MDEIKIINKLKEIIMSEMKVIVNGDCFMADIYSINHFYKQRENNVLHVCFSTGHVLINTLPVDFLTQDRNFSKISDETFGMQLEKAIFDLDIKTN